MNDEQFFKLSPRQFEKEKNSLSGVDWFFYFTSRSTKVVTGWHHRSGKWKFFHLRIWSRQVHRNTWRTDHKLSSPLFLLLTWQVRIDLRFKIHVQNIFTSFSLQLFSKVSRKQHNINFPFSFYLSPLSTSLVQTALTKLFLGLSWCAGKQPLNVVRSWILFQKRN